MRVSTQYEHCRAGLNLLASGQISGLGPIGLALQLHSAGL